MFLDYIWFICLYGDHLIQVETEIIASSSIELISFTYDQFLMQVYISNKLTLNYLNILKDSSTWQCNDNCMNKINYFTYNVIDGFIDSKSIHPLQSLLIMNPKNQQYMGSSALTNKAINMTTNDYYINDRTLSILKKDQQIDCLTFYNVSNISNIINDDYSQIIYKDCQFSYPPIHSYNQIISNQNTEFTQIYPLFTDNLGVSLISSLTNDHNPNNVILSVSNIELYQLSSLLKMYSSTININHDQDGGAVLLNQQDGNIIASTTLQVDDIINDYLVPLKGHDLNDSLLANSVLFLEQRPGGLLAITDSKVQIIKREINDPLTFVSLYTPNFLDKNSTMKWILCVALPIENFYGTYRYQRSISFLLSIITLGVMLYIISFFTSANKSHHQAINKNNDHQQPLNHGSYKPPQLSNANKLNQKLKKLKKLLYHNIKLLIIL